MNTTDETMKALLKMFPILLVTGCDVMEVDFSAPSPPGYVRTQAGDNYVQVYWEISPEEDVEAYNVYVSSVPEGGFQLIATTEEPYFFDRNCLNGNTYFYSVTAFDFSGNESDMSYPLAYAVPRPDGYGVILQDVRLVPDEAGFDFSAASIVPFDGLYADMFFVNDANHLFMVVRSEDTDIQDMGYTTSLSEITVAPSAGWNPAHEVRLIDGHTYVVWTWDDHYAKFRVNDVNRYTVEFAWAYQLQESNPLLKRPVSPGRGAERHPEFH